MRVLRLLALPLLVVMGVMAPTAQARPAHHDPGGPPIQVIATGLDSPRHLAFNGRGDLYVAEAGRGGDGPCFIAGEGPACMGPAAR